MIIFLLIKHLKLNFYLSIYQTLILFKEAIFKDNLTPFVLF